jgi:phosphoglycolate phosphatase-like HAD superfamily hydrolase
VAINATRPRLVLWDIDHTLIETRGTGGRLARAAFQEITGIRPHRMAVATGKTEPVILAETLLAHGIRPTEEHQRRYAETLPEQYRRHIDQLRQGGRALPGAAAALAALNQVPDLIQAVLTGNYRAVAAVKLAAFHLDGILDLEVGAYADNAADRAALVPIAQRRAGRKYQHAFTRVNTVIIGDTTHDVAAAYQGGAAIIAVTSGHHTADDLRAAGADIVLTSLADTAAVLRAVNATTPPQHTG